MKVEKAVYFDTNVHPLERANVVLWDFIHFFFLHYEWRNTTVRVFFSNRMMDCDTFCFFYANPSICGIVYIKFINYEP